MTGKKRYWRAAAALSVGSAVLAGCQQFGLAPARPTVALDNPAEALKISPHQAADVQVALGRSLEKRGDPAKAIAAYEEAIKRDPRRTDALLRLAILHDRQGQFQESSVWYRKALQTSPGNPDIYCDMGYSLYLQRRWAEAEMNLKQALALRPNLARAHNNLGLVLAHTERLDGALAEFRQAGSEADAHLNLALALVLDRRWDEARRQYQLAVTANPTSEAAANGLRDLDNLLARASAGLRPAPAASSSAADTLVAKLSPPVAEPGRAPELVLPVQVQLAESVSDLEDASLAPRRPPASSHHPAQQAEAMTPGLSQALTFYHVPVSEP
jgi:tetratricopeptide (TPR) repeat protein